MSVGYGKCWDGKVSHVVYSQFLKIAQNLGNAELVDVRNYSNFVCSIIEVLAAIRRTLLQLVIEKRSFSHSFNFSSSLAAYNVLLFVVILAN